MEFTACRCSSLIPVTPVNPTVLKPLFQDEFWARLLLGSLKKTHAQGVVTKRLGFDKLSLAARLADCESKLCRLRQLPG